MPVHEMLEGGRAYVLIRPLVQLSGRGYAGTEQRAEYDQC
jgi:hypothetical protein